jgi:hypothetical protein
LDVPLPLEVSGDRVGTSNIWWTFLDTVRTSPALAKALVKLERSLGEVSQAWDGSGEYDAPRAVCRKKRVLSQREVEALIEGYQIGRTVYKLGAECGIHRGHREQTAQKLT